MVPLCVPFQAADNLDEIDVDKASQVKCSFYYYNFINLIKLQHIKLLPFLVPWD